MNAGSRALLAFAVVAAPAAAVAQPRQDVINVFVVAQGAPMAESRVASGRPFFRQGLVGEDNLRRGYGIQFDLTPAALDALRDRHDMDDDQPFILAEWIERTPGSREPARHLGFLHCSLRLRTFVGVVSACLRDGDGDGRLDGVVTFAPSRFPAEGLQFMPIEPVGYRYVRQVPPPPANPAYASGGLIISYDFVRGTGRLRFAMNVLDLPFARLTPPSVEVDPAQLPATVELGGAQLTVTAWDGRRATVRVDRPFPTSLVRFIADQGDWRLEYFDLPLPGEPPVTAAP